MQKIIIIIDTRQIINSKWRFTASPKNINTKLTKKNLEPRPNRLTEKNFQKFIFKIPLPIVKILYGTGVKAEKNTAKEPYSLYISSTLSNLSTCFLNKNLKAGRPPQYPIAKPIAPPIAEAKVQIKA